VHYFIDLLQQLSGPIATLVLFGMVFAESGLLIGFFLPGDSLLFAAGFLASRGFFDLAIILFGTFIAAVAGDSVGYYTGHRYGRRIFSRENSFFFDKKHVERAEAFYEKHGKKTIIIARFVPIVRTFAPIVAGIGKMDYRTFVTYNLVGGFIWAFGNILAGYYLGKVIPDIDQYLLPIVAVIILLSIAQPAYHILQDADNRAKIMDRLRSFAPGK
jgi:membrane-associated protein